MTVRKAILLALPLLAACSGGGTASPAGTDLEQAVYVTLHPLEAVAAVVACGAVPVINPLPPGADPEHWAPGRDVLARYQRARLVLLSGAGLEGWARAASLPPSRTIDTSEGFRDELIAREVVTHSHGLGGEHSHGGTNGHLWLDPELLLRQGRAVHAALTRAWPEHAARFDTGLAALEAKLAALPFESLARALAPAAGPEGAEPRRPALVGTHPAHEYLGRYLGVELLLIDLDPDSAPSAGQLRRLEAWAEERGARAVLWAASPPPETALLLRERLGLASVVFDPAESPAEGDFFSIQAANARRLLEALE